MVLVVFQSHDRSRSSGSRSRAEVDMARGRREFKGPSANGTAELV